MGFTLSAAGSKTDIRDSLLKQMDSMIASGDNITHAAIARDAITRFADTAPDGVHVTASASGTQDSKSAANISLNMSFGDAKTIEKSPLERGFFKP